MLNSETKENFKLTVIRLIEECILEKLTQLDPNAIKNEQGYINSPLRWNFILAVTRKSDGISFLENHLKIPSEFWQLKYQWLHQAYKLAKNEEIHKFLTDEIYPGVELYQNINPNCPLVIYKDSAEEDNPDYSEVAEKLSDKCFNTVFLKKDYLTNLCAIKVATELLEKIDLPNITLSTLENIFGVSPKPAPITESKLSEIAGLPTPVPFRASVESNYRPDKWKKDSKNYGVFEASCQSNPKNRVEVFIAGENDSDILALEAARQVIDIMGIDAAKLQLAFASHVFNQNNLSQVNFSLKGTDILHQIGWDKKHRLTVSEKLAKIASIAFHLGRMLMQCTWIEGKPKGNKVDASVSISPLWVISVDARSQMNIFTGKVDEPDEVYITVRPGPWAEKWLNKMGAKAGVALHQFGWLATEILKIDPYHDELALKLAIHLTMASRIKVRDKNQYEHKAGSLLEAVELEARINAARQGFRQAYDLKQRWDSALKLLISMGWRVIFDETTYPDWLRPDSQAEKPSDWKKEKIIDRLWKAKLTIKPPEPIPALLAAKTEPLQLKPAAHTKSEPTLTGAEIRKQRQAKGVSQTALAEWAGKTKAWLCMVEKGKRKIDSKEAKELRAGINFLVNKSAQP